MIRPPAATEPDAVPSPRAMRSHSILFSGGRRWQRCKALRASSSGDAPVRSWPRSASARAAPASRRQALRSCCEALSRQAARSCR
ncbi:MAG: hypothetical protein A2W72_07885 [Burkholderiales bacterium RIFCSPLOWO2_12_67_14]|nr:MAG: hypothetical protein A3I64_22535 [Burkholderiales bacterium RIFCSPLOWO2_02_FULL_67_64]OGB42574.1 MAG: hypothetical protein A2W72_07885 [Burkholderiales bacterium RIFCSPLOWO2_12_67_14]OGB48588.1 MAG: hypothetical protein A3E51_03895 [Burkholderiales bacterium RIFCSPHIGHO2_12_FULL_67_38]OGC00419.1 MAG: hypothetical protein A3G82_21295 [Burkholderiales bacterium RIFCSPLOWO2_12_FULL_67_210]